MAEVRAAVGTEPIDEAALERFVMSPAQGALVTFRGIVRDHDGGRRVTALEYQSHPDAAAFLERACATIAERTGLPVAATHRVGALVVGDVALVAVVAAAHRSDAFAACADLVDLVKSSVPIWKRQRFVDGESEWVGL